MIVDTSALAAIILNESGFDGLLAKLADSDSNGIGTPTLVELGVVVSTRSGRDPRGVISYVTSEFNIHEIAFTDQHWREAIHAHQRYGTGRHPAGLNFGDCMTYAVAKLADEPLLFVGDDFSQTDLKVA